MPSLDCSDAEGPHDQELRHGSDIKKPILSTESEVIHHKNTYFTITPQFSGCNYIPGSNIASRKSIMKLSTASIVAILTF